MSVPTGSVSEAVPLAQAVADLIERSDERQLYLDRILAAGLRGYHRGHADGYLAGYEAAEADMAAAWHDVAYPVAHPEAYRREAAARGLRAAEAGERRDAAEHERAFVARAWNTPAHLRTDVQKATVLSYPPPRLRRVR
jgi:hypothetical protein